MNRGRILVADDEEDLRVLVGTLLERAGFDVVQASDGLEALQAFYSHRPDLVVLDVSMPRLDGFEALGRIRELSDVPVLMLTAREAELERVRGLKSGADDYVAKPFGRQELIARVEVLLRRGAERAPHPEVYADPVITVDFHQRRATVAERELELSPLEFKLLAAFVRHPNQVLSHEQLLDLVWQEAFATSRDQVKLYVSYLRRKLRSATETELVETVRGFGYRYARPRPTEVPRQHW